MIIFVDIDETICRTKGVEYSEAEPIYERIEKINKLYSEENTIVYWTARGSKTNKNWFNITYEQLIKWGVKFHELRMGKPVYDLFIDDKNVSSCEYFKQLI